MAVNQDIVKFMLAINVMDRAGLGARDVTILCALKSKPGLRGRELAQTIGWSVRTHVQEQVKRLIRDDLIEDRRILDGRPLAYQRTPNNFHLTQKGKDFLEKLFVHF